MQFKEIYEAHKNLVFNLALQYCQNPQDAEEITQDVFLNVHQKFHSFNNQSDIKTWIYRICINKSLDFIKKKNRKKRAFFFKAFSIDDQKNHLNASDFNHPGVELEQKEAIKGIFKAINQLVDRQKSVIILLKIEQLSVKEASEILEISSKAVESLFQRAKKNLEKLLDNTKKPEGK